MTALPHILIRSSACVRLVWIATALACAALPAGGCSVRTIAVHEISAALSDGSAVYAEDDDPELVRSALPFALKLTESLLAENPKDRRLLTAAASGFTQFAYAFVQQDADRAESLDVRQATVQRSRAVRLYLRGRDYGLRGLSVDHPGFARQVRADAQAAVRTCRRADVALLYWTSASWAAAISLSKDKPDLVADQPIVEAMIDRALALDDGFERGSIHTFLITYEMARQGQASDPANRARQHYQRAVELSHGQSAAPMLALAEAVSVAKQDRAEFESLLRRAVAIDVNAEPKIRLMNVILQERARWLLSRVDELFVE